MPAYRELSDPLLGELALNHGAGFPTLLGAGPSVAVALAIGLGGCWPIILAALRAQPRLAPAHAVRAGRRA